MNVPYRIAVNVEWTSKCNALCPMCPREAIEHPQIMSMETWSRVLQRLDPKEVFRVVIAGYGEPTTHPRFGEFVEALRPHPVRFDMVSNGHLLDPEKIARLDGAIGVLMVSFSSIDPDIYRRVHVNLDQRRVMENLKAARAMLKHTRLAISLTPMPDCLPALPATIAWLNAQGVDALTMSPSLYNRGGSLTEHRVASRDLRRLIARHKLRSQELDFVPSGRDLFRQWRRNRYRCVPRNVDLFVASSGDYLYCYNDAGHRHPIGNVAADGIGAAVRRREEMDAIPSLCGDCNMRDRYRLGELARAGIAYARCRLRAAGPSGRAEA